MKLRSAALLALCLFQLLFVGIFANLENKIDNGKVFHLTSETFDKSVEEPDSVWILDFYAPWCGHCQKLKPEFEKTAIALRADPQLKNVRLGMVDCTIHSDICERFNVRGYPTLFTHREKLSSPYRGPRSSAGLLSHAKMVVVPPVRPFLGLKDVGDDLVAAYDAGALSSVAFIYLGGPGVHMKAFQRAATKSSGEALFYAPGGTWHTDRIKHGLQHEDMYKTLGKSVGIELYNEKEYSPVLLALKQLVAVSQVLTLPDLEVAKGSYFVPESITNETEMQITLNVLNAMPLVMAFIPSTPAVILPLKNTPVVNDEESPLIENFITNNKYPLISHLNGFNFSDMLQGKIQGRKGVLLAMRDATANDVRAFLPLAAKYRSQALFSYLNENEYPGFFSQYELKPEHLPTVVVVDYMSDQYYVPEAQFTAGVHLQAVEEFSNFLETVLGPGDDKNGLHTHYQVTASPRSLSPWWKFTKAIRFVQRQIEALTNMFGDEANPQATYMALGCFLLFTLFIVGSIWFLLRAGEVFDPEIAKLREEAEAKSKAKDSRSKKNTASQPQAKVASKQPEPATDSLRRRN